MNSSRSVRFGREQVDDEGQPQESLEHVGVDEPYCAAIDGTALHRSSLKMPGTSWLRDARFSAFRAGIHRAQRFLHGAWLTPLEAGYSRAIPLRFLPAFPPKAISADVPARREWEVHQLVAARAGWCWSSQTEAAGPGRRGL